MLQCRCLVLLPPKSVTKPSLHEALALLKSMGVLPFISMGTKFHPVTSFVNDCGIKGSFERIQI